jgi:hypothetical protein
MPRTGPIRTSARRALAYCCLDDLPNLAPTSLNDTLQVLECLACLRFDSAINKCTSLGIEAETSRDKHERGAHNGLAVRPDCLGRICGVI